MRNFEGLSALIATYTVRDDLADVIPTFIALAEARLQRELPVAEREAETISTISSTEIVLPSDFAGVRTIHLETDPITILEPMGLDALHRLGGGSGKPAFYAIVSGVGLTVRPEPDQDYVFNLNYYQRIPALSDSNPSNWLIEDHPDAYLAASLVEAFAFLMDEQRATFWEARTQGAIAAIRSASNRKSGGGAPMRLKNDLPLADTFGINRG